MWPKSIKATTCLHLLQLLALVHVMMGHEVYMHWVHRIILIIAILSAIAVFALLSSVYNHGWTLQHISLMVRLYQTLCSLACA